MPSQVAVAVAAGVAEVAAVTPDRVPVAAEAVAEGAEHLMAAPRRKPEVLHHRVGPVVVVPVVVRVGVVLMRVGPVAAVLVVVRVGVVLMPEVPALAGVVPVVVLADVVPTPEVPALVGVDLTPADRVVVALAVALVGVGRMLAVRDRVEARAVVRAG